jgi:hypothetical protein
MKRRVVRDKVDRPRHDVLRNWRSSTCSVRSGSHSSRAANDTRRGGWGACPHVQPRDASVERWRALVRARRSRLGCDRLLPASSDLLFFVKAPRAAYLWWAMSRAILTIDGTGSHTPASELDKTSEKFGSKVGYGAAAH